MIEMRFEDRAAIAAAVGPYCGRVHEDATAAAAEPCTRDCAAG